MGTMPEQGDNDEAGDDDRTEGRRHSRGAMTEQGDDDRAGGR